jgi:putative effector of murein hydrolase LrgA (UPF0299 family)
MLGFFVVVLALWLAGDAIAALVLPIVPGPLIGMVLLLGAFVLRGGVPASFEAPAAGLVGHLTLFILPASLGILEAYDRVAEGWARYALVLLAGSLVTAVVTAAVAGGLLNRRRTPPSRRPPSPPPAR